MARKGDKKQQPPIGNPTDPNSLYAFMLRFLEWSAIKNYSANTIEKRGQCLREFIHWCDERGLQQPAEITKPMLERYQRHLFYRRKPNGQSLSSRSQRSRLIPIRAYFKWLAQENYILYNPASELELPRVEHRLPKAILSPSEVQQVMNQADLNTGIGIRDRAILETLYSTGARRSELVMIQYQDVDRERGTLIIRQGKGKKDRMIPIGERALAWINRYLEEVRPELISGRDDGVLFLSQFGEAITPSHLTDQVRRYVISANIGKTGSCHLFRHAMATHMLENGADIRFIQAMLGHADLSTTQIYTQVSIKQLKDIHTATHPAKLRSTNIAVNQQEEPTAEALLSALEAEASEEP